MQQTFLCLVKQFARNSKNYHAVPRLGLRACQITHNGERKCKSGRGIAMMPLLPPSSPRFHLSFLAVFANSSLHSHGKQQSENDRLLRRSAAVQEERGKWPEWGGIKMKPQQHLGGWGRWGGVDSRTPSLYQMFAPYKAQDWIPMKILFKDEPKYDLERTHTQIWNS